MSTEDVESAILEAGHARPWVIDPAVSFGEAEEGRRRFLFECQVHPDLFNRNAHINTDKWGGVGLATAVDDIDGVDVDDFGFS